MNLPFYILLPDENFSSQKVFTLGFFFYIIQYIFLNFTSAFISTFNLFYFFVRLLSFWYYHLFATVALFQSPNSELVDRPDKLVERLVGWANYGRAYHGYNSMKIGLGSGGFYVEPTPWPNQ